LFPPLKIKSINEGDEFKGFNMGTFVESLRNYHDKKIDMKEIDPKIKEEKRKNKEEIE